jgi:DNA adenine methylase
MEPVLKWAGGKRQLLAALLQYITPELLKGHRFFEPFIGGGSVAFALEHPATTFNDYNPELINAYRMIKEDPDGLIDLLEEHQKNHSKEYFYQVRAMDREAAYAELPALQKAARLIYLNRTCFNGLYRVNRQNHFNVPFGRPLSRDVVQKEKIYALSEFLNNHGVEIYQGDFAACLSAAKAGDVIYFDPPYDYEETGFNKYVTNIFGRADLQRLHDECIKLIKKGCIVIVSNNDTTFVREVFNESVFKINGVEAKRYINCKGNKRSGIKEVIIYGKK